MHEAYVHQEQRRRRYRGGRLEVFVDGVREFTGLIATLDKIIFNPGGGVNGWYSAKWL